MLLVSLLSALISVKWRGGRAPSNELRHNPN